MEILKYVIEDDKIAELFGVQNFTNKESAILELVKNAYDAGASNLSINFDDDKIILIDDGTGMSYNILKDNWTKVGLSNKAYDFVDKDAKQRIYSGSKGIGRFALARLGKQIEVQTKMLNNNGARWTTDWSITKLDFIQLNTIGTTIIIKQLRDKWSIKAIENLSNYLSTTYNDDSMKITLNYLDKIFTVERKFMKPTLGVNCLSIIKLNYNAKTKDLTSKIISDEFLDEAISYCPTTNLHDKISIINMKNEVFDDIELDDKDKELALEELGSFTAELYFAFNPQKDDCEKFLYKYNSLQEPYKDGVILYRNVFSISSYEGKKDWLGLGKRSRKSPAAATHPTGSWRVRENQLSGKVIIDKKENNNLKDLANRQGLEETEYYKLFLQIIDKGIAEFERYRQSIVRAVNIKNKEEIKETRVLDSFLRKPSEFKDYDEEKVVRLAEEVKDLKESNEKQKKDFTNKEEEHRYDTRILNVLSTVGLKAASIAHEMKTNRNFISYSSENLVNRLKELNIWDIINAEENKKLSYKNVPLMIEKSNAVISKIKTFMDTMLTKIEKKQFVSDNLNINEIFEKIKKSWEYDYNWLDITLEISSDLEFFTCVDVINVIFDNLLLNSVQQNKGKKKLDINIKANKNDTLLEFEYMDNGVGLNSNYINDPRRILEVHESSRTNGHGLGMWIINNSLIMSGGEVNEINGHGGFKIKFTLGDKL
ncbi:MAG: ATP-binding protein [Bacilli bacterium]|nr:ATP-binding protein [Bacilli bacterium]